MLEIVNLSHQMEQQLPAELVSLMQSAGTIAAEAGWRLYLVGGVVRDLLLERKTVDLDLVVEGDALYLARRLGETTGGKVVAHSRFGTATLRWAARRIDLATARAETYAMPGALPAVKPGSLADDLFRRDFTVNAMAVELSPERWGQMVDLYGGRADLTRRLIRVLHEKSFIDDATRIWRAIRYEQRLGFNIETRTLKLLKRDLPYLDTISGDRIRHELDLVLREEQPEKALRRAGNLGVLGKLHSNLKGNGWLKRKFEEARRLTAPASPPVALYLSLLAYRLTEKEIEELVAYLRLPGSLSHVLRDVIALKASLKALSQPTLRPSRVYSLLDNHDAVAISALSFATDSEAVRDHIRDYLDRLRYVRPALTGEDLVRMGILPGPQISALLQKFLEARLDGKVKSKEEEEGMVKRWVGRV